MVYDLLRKVHEDPNELDVHCDGTQVRDFNHVANAVDALLLVADGAKLEGEVYTTSPPARRSRSRSATSHR